MRVKQVEGDTVRDLERNILGRIARLVFRLSEKVLLSGSPALKLGVCALNFEGYFQQSD